MSFLTAGYWNIGDGGKKMFFDDIFGNTIINAQRERIIGGYAEASSAGPNTDQATYQNILGSLFIANGDLLDGQKLRWEIEVYLMDAGIGDNSKIQLYNVTDAVAVAASEVSIPYEAGDHIIVLPASSANYFTLASGEKKYRIQFKSGTAGKFIRLQAVRLVAMMV